MAKVCKKCGRTVGDNEFYHSYLCQNCYHQLLGNQNNKTNITTNGTGNDDTSGCIVALIFIGIIIFIIISIGSSIKKDAEYRKQKELMEFDSQLHQDPSTWDKKQRDRFDSFINWDSKN